MSTEFFEKITDHYSRLLAVDVATDPRFQAAAPPRGTPAIPVPFFGSLERAEYLTFGANPSAEEIARRGWQLGNVSGASLAQFYLEYFERPELDRHPWFQRWSGVLPHDRFSYINNLAHLDLFPWPTVSLSSLGGNAAIDLISLAVERGEDVADLLSFRWSSLRGIILGGTFTKCLYLDEAFERVLNPHGFSVQLVARLTGRSKNPRAQPKIYLVTFDGHAIPVLFLPAGPSARMPADQKYFASLTSTHLPQFEKHCGSTTNEEPLT